MILKLLILLQIASAAPDPIRARLEWRTCTKSSECEAVPLRCGCCQYQGISKLYVTEYLDANRDPGCVDEPCHCQPLKLVPRCVRQRCELVKAPSKARAEAPKKKREKKAR